MSEAEILNQLKIVAREHTIKVVEGHIEETMPASVVNELRLNNFSAKILLDYITNLQNQLQQKENIIKEVREYIEENQEEHKYTDRGGFTYTEGHFLRDSDILLEILDKVDKGEINE